MQQQLRELIRETPQDVAYRQAANAVADSLIMNMSYDVRQLSFLAVYLRVPLGTSNADAVRAWVRRDMRQYYDDEVCARDIVRMFRARLNDIVTRIGE